MNSFSAVFGGLHKPEYLEIGYHHIDYLITFSGRQFLVVRGACGGGLMDQSIEGARVKEVLSAISQGHSLARPKELKFPKQGVILSHEHGNPGEEVYIIFKPLKGRSEGLQAIMKTKLHGILKTKETFIFLNPQNDMFQEPVRPTRSQKPVLVTEKDRNTLLHLVATIAKVQDKFYKDFTA